MAAWGSMSPGWKPSSGFFFGSIFMPRSMSHSSAIRVRTSNDIENDHPWPFRLFKPRTRARTFSTFTERSPRTASSKRVRSSAVISWPSETICHRALLPNAFSCASTNAWKSRGIPAAGAAWETTSSVTASGATGSTMFQPIFVLRGFKLVLLPI